jgi:hypothetical protein
MIQNFQITDFKNYYSSYLFWMSGDNNVHQIEWESVSVSELLEESIPDNIKFFQINLIN